MPGMADGGGLGSHGDAQTGGVVGASTQPLWHCGAIRDVPIRCTFGPSLRPIPERLPKPSDDSDDEQDKAGDDPQERDHTSWPTMLVVKRTAASEANRPDP